MEEKETNEQIKRLQRQIEELQRKSGSEILVSNKEAELADLKRYIFPHGKNNEKRELELGDRAYELGNKWVNFQIIMSIIIAAFVIIFFIYSAIQWNQSQRSFNRSNRNFDKQWNKSQKRFNKEWNSF